MSNYPQLKKSESIKEISACTKKSVARRPLFLSGVSAGFPSPADDYLDRKLDLNEYMIKNPAATFFVRVAGESMTGAGINDDDILIVDRSLEATSGDVVIAVINGELAVKRLLKKDGVCQLIAENPLYPPLKITGDTPLEIWGVVTYAIHRL
jgi:DNA polymerase V